MATPGVQPPANGGERMKRLLAITIGVFCLSTVGVGVSLAGPGDPIGGDDPGCAPANSADQKCSDGLLKAYTKAWGSVIKCHSKMASAAFKAQAPATDEACETAAGSGGSGKSAQEKFTAAETKLAASCTNATITGNVNTLATTLFADKNTAGSADAQAGGIYCDPGINIDSEGDDAGTVNITATDASTRLKCANGVNKALGKVVKSVAKCHGKSADGQFKGAPVDDEACEDNDPINFKSALQKYDAAMTKLDPICTQACLSSSNRHGLAVNYIAFFESNNIGHGTISGIAHRKLWLYSPSGTNPIH